MMSLYVVPYLTSGGAIGAIPFTAKHERDTRFHLLQT
jgi:hypothetical protein